MDARDITILGDSGDDTTAISAHDPGFDQTNFLAWTEQAHFAVVNALNNGDVNALSPYVADTLFPRLQAQAEHHASSPKADPNSQHPSIVRAGSDASFDTVVVRLQEHDRAVDWTFQRSSKLQTTPGPLKASEPAACPVCGSPRQLDANGLCVYCKTPGPPPKFDWLLVQMETAPPDIASVIATQTKHTGLWVAIFVIVVVLFSVGLPVVLSLYSSHHTTTTDNLGNAFSNIGAGSGDTSPPAPKTLTVELTLSGADQLSPSTLDMGDLSLNGEHFGDCPTAPLQNISLNLTFDSGDVLTGTFSLPKAAAVGPTIDFAASGGTAMLHQVGASGDPSDDQTWTLAPGKGTVTLKADSSDGGTLTWTDLASGEPNHTGFNPLSGVAVWTCS